MGLAAGGDGLIKNSPEIPPLTRASAFRQARIQLAVQIGRREWLQKCTSHAMEVHNVKVIGGRNSPGSHLFDPASGFQAEGAWLEEGYVRFGKVHHRNA